MLKFLKSHFLVASAALATIMGIGLFQKADASSTASATATANSNIITSIAITKTTDVNFGDAAQSDIAKVMSAASAPSGAGWAGSPTRGAFAVTGQASKAYSVGIAPASVTMITGGGGTADLQIVVNAFTYYSTQAASGSSAALTAGGTDTLYLAGTQAAIRVTQTAGVYVSPVITVTVTYL